MPPKRRTDKGVAIDIVPQDDTADNDKTAAGDSVAVTFFSTTCKFTMPEQSYTIPLGTLPDGLSQLVNTVLDLDPPVPFDFLLNDEFVATTLEKFLLRRAISTEHLLHIEYTPSMQAKEGNKMPHDDWVSCIRCPVVGHSNILVTGAYDQFVRVWDDEDVLCMGHGHDGAVAEVCCNMRSLKVSLGAEKAAAGGAGGSRKRGKDKAQVLQPGSSMDMVSVGKDGTMRLWKFNALTAQQQQQQQQQSPSKQAALPYTLDCRAVFAEHTSACTSVDITYNGSIVATSSHDGQVKIWSWDDIEGTATAAAAAASTSSSSAKARTSTNLNANNANKNILKLQPLAAFNDHARAVLKTRFTPNDKRLLSAGLDGNAKIWNIETLQLVQTIMGDHSIQGMHAKPTHDSAASDDCLILLGCTDNRIRLFDTRQKGVAKTWTGHRQWVYGVTWFWRPDEATLPAAAATAASAAAAAGGGKSTQSTYLASCSEDATVRVWDLRSTSGALVTMSRLHTDGVLDLTYCGNGEVASGGKDNKTKTVRIEGGQQV